MPGDIAQAWSFEREALEQNMVCPHASSCGLRNMYKDYVG